MSRPDKLVIVRVSTIYDQIEYKGERIMAKECGVCGKSLGALSGKIPVIDGHVCTGCWSKAGLEGAMTAVGQMMGKQYTIGQIKDLRISTHFTQH